MYNRPPPLRKKSGIFLGEVTSVHRLQRVGEGIRKYIALYINGFRRPTSRLRAYNKTEPPLIGEYRKIPKISPWAYTFQRPFLWGLFLEGLIYGEKFAFQNRLG